MLTQAPTPTRVSTVDLPINLYLIEDVSQRKSNLSSKLCHIRPLGHAHFHHHRIRTSHPLLCGDAEAAKSREPQSVSRDVQTQVLKTFPEWSGDDTWGDNGLKHHSQALSKESAPKRGKGYRPWTPWIDTCTCDTLPKSAAKTTCSATSPLQPLSSTDIVIYYFHQCVTGVARNDW